MLAGTRTQISYWKDSASLYRHALSVTRDNYLACHFLATLLEEQGQLDEAEKLYRESLRLHAGVAGRTWAWDRFSKGKASTPRLCNPMSRPCKWRPRIGRRFTKQGR